MSLAPALCKVCDLPYSEVQCDSDVIGRNLYFHYKNQIVCTYEEGRDSFSAKLTINGIGCATVDMTPPPTELDRPND